MHGNRLSLGAEIFTVWCSQEKTKLLKSQTPVPVQKLFTIIIDIVFVLIKEKRIIISIANQIFIPKILFLVRQVRAGREILIEIIKVGLPLSREINISMKRQR